MDSAVVSLIIFLGFQGFDVKNDVLFLKKDRGRCSNGIRPVYVIVDNKVLVNGPFVKG